MAVLALNQRQSLNGDQFFADFKGVNLDDLLLVKLGSTELVFSENVDVPFLRWQHRFAGELRALVTLGEVPDELETFSFQVRAVGSTKASWTLHHPSSGEMYQNYDSTIEAGKTLELLEFTRSGNSWVICTKNQTIGDVPLPEEQSRYPEHLRDLAMASSSLNPGDWSSVRLFIEVNENSVGNLPTQLYLDTITAVQAISARVKLAPMEVTYAKFGTNPVAIEDRIEEHHRLQLKLIAANGYNSSMPTTDQLSERVDSLPSGGVLFALVNTIGGFDVPGMLERLETKGAYLYLLAMRPVAFGIVPDLGGSPRLKGFAVADLANHSPRSVVELLRSKD